MTQIPPRGTPEFEEYKKTVEEAFKSGSRVQVQDFLGASPEKPWEDIEDPVWFWEGCLYRIAPNQPQSLQNQAPEPSMTSAEQRIVKALDRLIYSLTEVEIILHAGKSDVRMERLAGSNKAAFKVIDGLLADLPLPSPSEAPSEAVAPAVGAGNGQSADYVWSETSQQFFKKGSPALSVSEAIEAAGKAEATPTGAVRSSVYPKGVKFPIRLDLLFRNAAGLRRLAETWAEGNEKYGPDNWMKGFSESCIISHTLEHVRLYLAGDKSEDHLAHGAWNLLALCWVEENKPELLDLTKPNQKP